MLLQVYYGQDDDNFNGWPLLCICIAIYFGYKWIQSVNNGYEKKKWVHEIDKDMSDSNANHELVATSQSVIKAEEQIVLSVDDVSLPPTEKAPKKPVRYTGRTTPDYDSIFDESILD